MRTVSVSGASWSVARACTKLVLACFFVSPNASREGGVINLLRPRSGTEGALLVESNMNRQKWTAMDCVFYRCSALVFGTRNGALAHRRCREHSEPEKGYSESSSSLSSLPKLRHDNTYTVNATPRLRGKVFRTIRSTEPTTLKPVRRLIDRTSKF